MYGATFYIEPKDILNRLSEEDRTKFNQCVFTNVRLGRDGSAEMDCVFFNNQDVDEKPKCRYRLPMEAEVGFTI